MDRGGVWPHGGYPTITDQNPEQRRVRAAGGRGRVCSQLGRVCGTRGCGAVRLWLHGVKRVASQVNRWGGGFRVSRNFLGNFGGIWGFWLKRKGVAKPNRSLPLPCPALPCPVLPYSCRAISSSPRMRG